MSPILSENMIIGNADTNYDVGSEMSGVSAISYTLNSCARHEKFAYSLRTS